MSWKLSQIVGTPNKGVSSKFSFSSSGSPLSPFRQSEDSFKYLVSDLERDNWKIPLNLTSDIGNTSIPCSPHPLSPTSPLPSPMTPPTSRTPILHNNSSPTSRPTYLHYNSSPISRPPILPYAPSPLSRQDSCLMSLSSGSVGSQGTPGCNIREFEETTRDLKKENLSLKLRIYFLEERMQALGGDKSVNTLISENIDLKVQLASCKKELINKLELLVEASDMLEHFDEHINNGKELMVKQSGVELKNKHELQKLKREEEIYEINKKNNEDSNSSFEINSLESSMPTSEISNDDFEEEIESLNTTLDQKNLFISALQIELEQQKQETEKLANILKLTEKDLRASYNNNNTKLLRNTKKTKEVAVNTEAKYVDVINLLEEEICYKNQELNEVQAELKIRDDKIMTIEKATQNKLKDEQDKYKEEFRSLTSTNKKLSHQMRLQTQERKQLLRNIADLQETVGELMNNQEESQKKVATKDGSTQCDTENSSSHIMKVYQHHLSSHRAKVLRLRKNVAKSAHDLSLCKRQLDNLVKVIQRVVSWDDRVTILEEVKLIVNNENCNSDSLTQSDMECFDSFNDNHRRQIRKKKCNRNSGIDDLQQNMIDFVIEEIHGTNSEIMENFGIISSLENELETKDLLIEKQNDVINDFTALLEFQKENQQTINLNASHLREPPDGREKKSEKRRALKCPSLTDSDAWSQPDKSISQQRIGIKLSNPSDVQDFRNLNNEEYCHDDCLYKEIAALGRLMKNLLKHIQFCEIVGSDIELEAYEKEGETLIERDALSYKESALVCHHCASSSSQDFWEMMQSVRSSLHSAHTKATGLIHNWRKLYKRTLRAEEEEERIKDKLGEYKVLIARLSDQNLKMTGERLDFNSRLEEVEDKRKMEVKELEDQIKNLSCRQVQNRLRNDQLTITLRNKEQPSCETYGKHSPTQMRETFNKERSWGTDDEKEGRKLLYENRNFLGFHLPESSDRGQEIEEF